LRRLAILLVLLAFPAMAVELDDKAYYERTQTKPPIQGEWLLGFGTNYADELGVDGLFGYHFKDAGVTLLGRIGAVKLTGENGSTEFRRFCRVYNVPYSTGDRTETEVALSVLFTLKKYK
jgi:hypothetical protein